MTAKVVEGKNGRLFLHNDSNKVMRQITGLMKGSRREFDAIGRTHAARAALCASLGIAYRHVVCPNKESVETHDLPDAFQYERYGPTYLARYAGTDPPPFFYDRHVLARQDLYFRTDSHWTERGALTYLGAALRSYEDERALRRLHALAATPAPIQRQGDLGLKLGWGPEDAVGVNLPSEPAALLFESNMPGEGNVRFHRSPAPANKGARALVLHDSFTTFLYRFVCELYEETLFIHTPDLDPTFLKTFAPDVLWFFQAERFLPRLPRNDVDFVKLLQKEERRKGAVAHGSVYLATRWPRRAG